MIKTKNLTITAVFGFVLSFLISIFSTHNFGRSLLRGILFALMFGALAMGIDYLIEKFLETGNETNPLSEVGTGKNQSTVGNKVDITVSDDNLTDDGDGLKFSVSGGLNRNDVSASAPKAEAEDSEAQKVSSSGSSIQTEVSKAEVSSGSNESVNSVSTASESNFVPVQLGQPFMQSSVSEETPKASESMATETSSVSAASSQPMDAASARKAAARAEREAGIKEVGALPDIGAFIPETKASSEDDDAGIIDDSDFASDDNPDLSFAKERNAGSSTLSSKDHDSDTMAKAIRTLLSRDN